MKLAIVVGASSSVEGAIARTVQDTLSMADSTVSIIGGDFGKFDQEIRNISLIDGDSQYQYYKKKRLRDGITSHFWSQS